MIAGGQNQAAIHWRKNPEVNIAGYLLYRTQQKEKSRDWREMDLIKANAADRYTVEVTSLEPVSDFEFVDQIITPRQTYYYGLVAIAADGNGQQLPSPMSTVKSGQAFDLTPPETPDWEEITRETAGGIEQIRLEWTSKEKLFCLIKKREASALVFQSTGEWLDIGTYNSAMGIWKYQWIDAKNLKIEEQYIYQVCGKDVAGNQRSSVPSEPV